MMNHKILKGLRTLLVASLTFSVGAMATDIQVDGGSVLLGSDIQSIVINPSTDLIQITTTAGDWDLVQGNDPDPSDPVPQVTFTVNSGSSVSVDINTTVALSWAVSDAASCETLGGNAVWDATAIPLVDGAATGSQTNTVDFVGTRSYTLRCVNGANTTTRSVTVTGIDDTPPPVGDACPAEYVPTLSGSDVEWASVLGQTWPQPSYSQRTLTVPRGGYLSIAFDTGDFAGWRGSYKTITAIGTLGNRLIAISKCAGDFSEQLPIMDLDACTEDQYNGGAVAWSTQTTPSSGFCGLDPNTTYYINITFVEGGVAGNTDRCSGTSCRTVLQVYATD